MNGTAAHGNTPPQPPSASVLTLRPTTPDPDKSDALYGKRGSRPCGDVPMSWPGSPPRRRTRMPTSTRSPSRHGFTGSAELNAMVERVAPSILGLLAEGVPRTKPEIVEALAGRHDR